MIRAVLDANVIVSAILNPHGTPARVLAAWQEERFAVATSPAILREVRRVLEYPRLARRHGWTRDEIGMLVADFAAISISTPGELRLDVVPEDPSDNRYLECAIEADAGYVVTGDTDLLRLGEYRGVRIVTPREFLTRLRDEPSN